MNDEAERFRSRARQCRDVASQSRDGHMRELLVRTTEDLEEEAVTIEAEEQGGPANRGDAGPRNPG
jgi:hypothetical protein